MPEVSVKLRDRTIQVACEDAEYAATRDAANLLSGELKKIPEENETYGFSTVLLLAGLNMADQILTMSRERSTAASSQPNQECLESLKNLADLAESTADLLEAKLGGGADDGIPSEANNAPAKV